MMPPSAGQLGGITGSEMAGSSSSKDSATGSAGQGFNIDTENNNSGFIGENNNSGFIRDETVGESASSGNLTAGGADSGPGDFSQSNRRNFGSGSRDSGAEPFLGDSGSSSRFGDSEQEARTGDFKSTNKLQDILFNFDRYDLDDESRSILRSNAEYLKASPMAKIEIQGHCDERGTNNYNIALGERRAQSTKMYMVSQGISSKRIHTISYGEEKPFCFDSNNSCWAKNRRAHFRISQ